MADAPSAFPLAWPIGWPRTKPGDRMPPKFRSQHEAGYSKPIVLTDARERLQRELDLLRASGPILSSNLELRLDGAPRSGQPEPADPGAAIYFNLRGKPIVFACDRWTTVAGNVAAIAAHLDAMRGMERWGVGSIEQLFSGYLALPAPLVPDDWRTVLGDPVTLEEAEATYRRLMRTAHPDYGGSHAAASALNAAIEHARQSM